MGEHTGRSNEGSGENPCSEEYLIRKCEEALGGNVKLPGPGRTTV